MQNRQLVYLALNLKSQKSNYLELYETKKALINSSNLINEQLEIRINIFALLGSDHIGSFIINLSGIVSYFL